MQVWGSGFEEVLVIREYRFPVFVILVSQRNPRREPALPCSCFFAACQLFKGHYQCSPVVFTVRWAIDFFNDGQPSYFTVDLGSRSNGLKTGFLF